jgi:hypothetical protein
VPSLLTRTLSTNVVQSLFEKALTKSLLSLRAAMNNLIRLMSVALFFFSSLSLLACATKASYFSFKESHLLLSSSWFKAFSRLSLILLSNTATIAFVSTSRLFSFVSSFVLLFKTLIVSSKSSIVFVLSN